MIEQYTTDDDGELRHTQVRRTSPGGTPRPSGYRHARARGTVARPWSGAPCGPPRARHPPPPRPQSSRPTCWAHKTPLWALRARANPSCYIPQSREISAIFRPRPSGSPTAIPSSTLSHGHAQKSSAYCPGTRARPPRPTAASRQHSTRHQTRNESMHRGPRDYTTRRLLASIPPWALTLRWSPPIGSQFQGVCTPSRNAARHWFPVRKSSRPTWGAARFYTTRARRLSRGWRIATSRSCASSPIWTRHCRRRHPVPRRCWFWTSPRAGWTCVPGSADRSRWEATARSPNPAPHSSRATASRPPASSADTSRRAAVSTSGKGAVWTGAGCEGGRTSPGAYVGDLLCTDCSSHCTQVWTGNDRNWRWWVSS